MEHALVYCKEDTILPHHLPSGRHSMSPITEEPTGGGVELGFALPENLADLPYRDAKQRALTMFDDAYFSAVLRRTGGNISEAARQAGLDRSNFRRASMRTVQKPNG
jgi:DNA-binding NtrC family response regulator